jgi:hypothetical protein
MPPQRPDGSREGRRTSAASTPALGADVSSHFVRAATRVHSQDRAASRTPWLFPEARPLLNLRRVS